MLPCIIVALAEANLENMLIFFSKMDVKDSFCRIIFEEGEEWNLLLCTTSAALIPTIYCCSHVVANGMDAIPSLFIDCLRNGA